MPNGKLIDVYGTDPLAAGKNPGKTRFHFERTDSFKLLEGNKRIKVVYFNKNMDEAYRSQLGFFEDIYNA